MVVNYFHRKFCLAAITFVLAGIAALVLDRSWIILVPFVLILLPVTLQFIIQKPAVLFYILITTLPLSTEFKLTPSLGFDLPDELLMGTISLLAVLWLFHKPVPDLSRTLQHPLVILCALHMAWIGVACIYASNHWLAFKFLLAKSWFIIPFFLLPSIILSNKNSIRQLGLLLLIPMGFVVVQTVFRHSLYGFSFDGIKSTLSPFFRNHVTYSGMLVCLLVVAWAMYMLTPVDTRYKRVLFAGVGIGLLALVLAWSRGAWVALLFGIAGWFAIRKKILHRLLVVAVVVAVSISLWLSNSNRYLRFAPDFSTTIYHPELGEHLQATITLKDVSNAERFYRWVAAANMIAEKPLVGFGPNAFYPQYKKFTISPFKTWVSNNPEHSTVHNYFLLTLVEQGIPGLLFFCAFYFGMLLYSQRLYHKHTDAFYKIVALATGTILIMIGTLNLMSDLVETDKIGSLFWLCGGMLLTLHQKLPNASEVEHS